MQNREIYDFQGLSNTFINGRPRTLNARNESLGPEAIPLTVAEVGPDSGRLRPVLCPIVGPAVKREVNPLYSADVGLDFRRVVRPLLGQILD